MDKLSSMKRSGMVDKIPPPGPAFGEPQRARVQQLLAQLTSSGPVPDEEEPEEPPIKDEVPPTVRNDQPMIEGSSDGYSAPVPYWVVFDGVHMWFIFQQWKNYDFRLKPQTDGIVVDWTITEPSEALLSGWGLPNKIIHQQVCSFSGTYFAPSPHTLVVQRELISILKTPEYRILKILTQGQTAAEGALEF